MRFLAHRIKDPALLRIIRRFLKAGVLESGRFSASEAGTPQGGLVSPVPANIYLHYVLDLWFEKRYVRTCKGRSGTMRLAVISAKYAPMPTGSAGCYSKG
ncbi:retron-type reverse transcriptase [Methylocaldum marinum]|uniref:Retron-type reverse transcriptase n=1 Tax=Methylocaldum marinum TaxID=1432792 RepID=A0A250KN87_9GAMM|nr:hypothetical protein [Methylocaldum marinum]BBA33006.1 retron-type reverse transcriptase [Methylocaldum marinum]